MLKLDTSQQVEQKPASSRIILVRNMKMKLGLQSRVLNQQRTMRVRVKRLGPLLGTEDSKYISPIGGEEVLNVLPGLFSLAKTGQSFPAGFQYSWEISTNCRKYL